ncbi:hypothetical protein KAFR_0E04490 [Kazachstania africana CBS 2517]|uniref:Uncharacterized protein n=1 Tax=Kazachstania africana (strain ATCC 22294 / BCRC 22015 / CBS 2517 / CECT 1963 / NBRC 1671 / NRRL Y-8276) TaxID=1071382 RepID=H2AW49_KAZAF|nr:hypothetical protein KAFR_0E04490 [Kazachstania africana CBS 2517]CCF58599.1 hypothetical protein KAFR_0E04490 [Kazachstania africana CBS 2517]
MTSAENSIIVISGPVLQKCSDGTLRALTAILNKGYDLPRYKFNAVQSDRVQDHESFCHDFGLDEEGTMLYLLVNDIKDISSELKLIGTTGSYPLYSSDVPGHYNFSFENVLATIAYKTFPASEIPNSFEVTAFTSFGKGCGIEIANATIEHFKKVHPSCDSLIAKVITNHDLVPYYEKKLNYIELDRITVPKKETVKAKFHDSFKIACDIQVATLKRMI